MCPAYFESGILLREPAWHGLGEIVDEWPGSWAEARKLALPWEVEVQPLEVPAIVGGHLQRYGVPGYQLLVRDDKPLVDPNSEMALVNPEAILSVQPTTYQVIHNWQFGNVIESVVGSIGDDFAWETLLCLVGGRLVVALLRAREPLHIAADPSLNHIYLSFTTRHDGMGGLAVTPTNVRKVCWNTHNLAEGIAKREKVGWTVRHTDTWEDRIDEIRGYVAQSVGAGKAWAELADKLAGKKLIPATLDRLLVQTFKTDSAMVEKTVERIKREREQVRMILASPTCDGIAETMYGFVQAVDQWVDHVQPARSDETRFTRSWTRVPEHKHRALQLAMAAADL